MRRWLTWSAGIFVFLAAVAGYTLWRRQELPDPGTLAFVAAFIVIAAFLIPAESQIRRMRREREQGSKRLEDTFK